MFFLLLAKNIFTLGVFTVQGGLSSCFGEIANAGLMYCFGRFKSFKRFETLIANGGVLFLFRNRRVQLVSTTYRNEGLYKWLLILL